MKNRILRKYGILFLFLLITSVIILTGCGKDKKLYMVIDGMKIEYVNIHTDDQDKYLDDDCNSIGSYASGNKEASKPVGVKLSWDKSIGNDVKVLISESDDFSNALEYNSSTNSIEIFNIKINTVYHWKAIGEKETEVNHFIAIEKGIRNLDIDGITNARDLGGWETNDGCVVKQGMIYRTSKLNADETGEELITAKGIDVMNNVLKVKTELDLRRSSDNEFGSLTKSSLGDNVNYINIPMDSNGNIMLLNKKKFVELFDVFSNIDNYPIVFHCSIGTDRTGMVAFILNALLGVSDDDLYRDYLFSNFSNIDSKRTANVLEKNYYFLLDACDGENTQEKARNFLLNQGVSEESINSFINIMKENKK